MTTTTVPTLPFRICRTISRNVSDRTRLTEAARLVIFVLGRYPRFLGFAVMGKLFFRWGRDGRDLDMAFWFIRGLVFANLDEDQILRSVANYLRVDLNSLFSRFNSELDQLDAIRQFGHYGSALRDFLNRPCPFSSSPPNVHDFTEMENSTEATMTVHREEDSLSPGFLEPPQDFPPNLDDSSVPDPQTTSSPLPGGFVDVDDDDSVIVISDDDSPPLQKTPRIPTPKLPHPLTPVPSPARNPPHPSTPYRSEAFQATGLRWKLFGKPEPTEVMTFFQLDVDRETASPKWAHPSFSDGTPESAGSAIKSTWEKNHAAPPPAGRKRTISEVSFHDDDEPRFPSPKRGPAVRTVNFQDFQDLLQALQDPLTG